MSAPKDGGPAFPCPVGHIKCEHPEGHALRDWFAGMALQGMLCANAQAAEEVTDKNVDSVIAREAFASADAMLSAREAKP